MNIPEILSRKYSGSQWILDSDTYKGLTWLSETPKPTKAQLESAWPEVQSEIARQNVELARQAAYRIESDPIFFEYQRGDKTEQEWLDAVQAVKDAHPYPDTP